MAPAMMPLSSISWLRSAARLHDNQHHAPTVFHALMLALTYTNSRTKHGIIYAMCDYTQVQYKCSHLRYVGRAWCTKYQETYKRDPANVVAMLVILFLTMLLVLTLVQRLPPPQELQYVLTHGPTPFLTDLNSMRL
jgi:hypothetical protein